MGLLSVLPIDDVMLGTSASRPSPWETGDQDSRVAALAETRRRAAMEPFQPRRPPPRRRLLIYLSTRAIDRAHEIDRSLKNESPLRLHRHPIASSRSSHHSDALAAPRSHRSLRHVIERRLFVSRVHAISTASARTSPASFLERHAARTSPRRRRRLIAATSSPDRVIATFDLVDLLRNPSTWSPLHALELPRARRRAAAGRRRCPRAPPSPSIHLDSDQPPCCLRHASHPLPWSPPHAVAHPRPRHTLGDRVPTLSDHVFAITPARRLLPSISPDPSPDPVKFPPLRKTDTNR